MLRSCVHEATQTQNSVCMLLRTSRVFTFWGSESVRRFSAKSREFRRRLKNGSRDAEASSSSPSATFDSAARIELQRKIKLELSDKFAQVELAHKIMDEEHVEEHLPGITEAMESPRVLNAEEELRIREFLESRVLERLTDFGVDGNGAFGNTAAGENKDEEDEEVESATTSSSSSSTRNVMDSSWEEDLLAMQEKGEGAVLGAGQDPFDDKTASLWDFQRRDSDEESGSAVDGAVDGSEDCESAANIEEIALLKGLIHLPSEADSPEEATKALPLWDVKDAKAILDLGVKRPLRNKQASVSQVWMEHYRIDPVANFRAPTFEERAERTKTLARIESIPEFLRKKKTQRNIPVDIRLRGRRRNKQSARKETEEAWMWHDVYKDANRALDAPPLPEVLNSWFERVSKELPQEDTVKPGGKGNSGPYKRRPLYVKLMWALSITRNTEEKVNFDDIWDIRSWTDLPNDGIARNTYKRRTFVQKDHFLDLVDPALKFDRAADPITDDESDSLNPAVEQAVWLYHRRDPMRWGQRALSREFGISMVSIDCILRVKRIEQQLTDEGILPEWDFFTNLDDNLYQFDPDLLYPPDRIEPASLVDSLEFDRFQQTCEQHWRDRQAPLARPRSEHAAPADGSPADVDKPRRAPSRWRLLYTDTSTKGEDLTVKVVERNGEVRHANEEELIRAIQVESPYWRNRQRSILRHPDGYWWINEAREMNSEARTRDAAEGSPAL